MDTLRKIVDYIKKHPLLAIIVFFVAVAGAMSTFLDLPGKFCKYSDGRLTSTNVEQRLYKLWTNISQEEIKKTFGEPAFIRTFKDQEVYFYRGSNSFIAIAMTKDRYVGNFTIAISSEQFVGYKLSHPEIYGELIFGKQSMSKLNNHSVHVYGGIAATSVGVVFTIEPTYNHLKLGYRHTINLKAFNIRFLEFGEPNISFSILSGLDFCEEHPSESKCVESRKEVFKSVPGWLEVSLDSELPGEDWILRNFESLFSFEPPSSDWIARTCLFFGLWT